MNIFLDKEAPGYGTGYGTALGFICLGLLTAGVLEVCLKAANKRTQQLPEDEVTREFSDEQLDELGDKSPLFVYML